MGKRILRDEQQSVTDKIIKKHIKNQDISADNQIYLLRPVVVQFFYITSTQKSTLFVKNCLFQRESTSTLFHLTLIHFFHVILLQTAILIFIIYFLNKFSVFPNTG